MIKHRWKDDEVIGWARRYTARGYMTLMELEQEIGVSHSTLWWCFQRRLPLLDFNLYEVVMERLRIGTHLPRRGWKGGYK